MNRLGIKRYHNSEVLSNPLKEIPRHPEVIPHVDTLCWSHLELPLSWHHLRVGAGDSNSGVHATPVMRFRYISPIHLVGLGTHSWASQMGGYPGRAGCTLAQYQTKVQI